MGVEVRGLDRLRNKISMVSASAKQGAENTVREMTEEVRGTAESKLKSSIKHPTGELAGSVKDEVTTNSDGKVVGRVFSDKETAIFREFGTGPNGESSTKDLPQGITPVYTQKAWFIPTKDVPDLATMYDMPVIVIQGETYYLTAGQPARPWLYPSLKEVQERSDEILERNVAEAIKKGLK